MVIDEVEMQRHQQLEKLYMSTHAGKDFQKDIVRALEAFTAIGYKHIEAGTKLSEDCGRYGAENTNDKISAKGASIYGDAHKHVEKEQEDLNKLLSSQATHSFSAASEKELSLSVGDCCCTKGRCMLTYAFHAY